MIRHLVAPACAALLGSGAATAQTFPKFTGFVVDAANVIPPEQEAALTQRLDALQKATGNQLVVATVPDLQGYPIEDYGYRLLRGWGVGLKDVNNGAILLVAPNERKVRIEVGYGLEPVLTDALTSEIIRDTIVPRLRADDAAGALGDGAGAIMTAATPEPVQPLTVVDRPARRYPSAWWLLTIPAVMILLICCLRVYRRRRDDWREAEAEAARTRDAAARDKRRREAEVAREVERARAPIPRTRRAIGTDARFFVGSAPVAPAPIVVAPIVVPPPPPYTPPRREDPYVSPTPSYSSPSPPPPSPSSDYGSSSSGFDSGGGSFGGGGSDSSY